MNRLPPKGLLIIGAGRGLDFMFATAKEMNYEVHGTDLSPVCENKTLCDHFLQADATDIKSIGEYYQQAGPLGVLSSGYQGVYTAAVLASKFKQWGSLPGSVKKVMSKTMLRKHIDSGSDSKADHRVVTSLAGLKRAIAELSYPLIVKGTAANCGSRNIRVLNSRADYLRYKNNYSKMRATKLLVEKYYDWDTYGMVGIMHKGKLVCHHFFREYNRGELYPTEYEISGVGDGISASLNNLIARDLVKYLRKINYSDGPLDVDLLISPTKDKYRVIEIDPLLEGDLVIEHIALSTGLNLDKILISLAAGRGPIIPAKKPKGYALIRFFKDTKEKEMIAALIDKNSFVRRALRRFYLNRELPPKENSARDKWRFGYATFIFSNRRKLSHFRRL